MRSKPTPYRTQATAIGGRVGGAASCDGRLKVRLDRPDDPAGRGTNPEQLFAAAYAACFLAAIRRVAADEGLEIAADSNVTARVALDGKADQPISDGLSVQLVVDLPGIADEAAARLIAGAHRICPYSRAIRGNVDVGLRLG